MEWDQRTPERRKAWPKRMHTCRLSAEAFGSGRFIASNSPAHQLSVASWKKFKANAERAKGKMSESCKNAIFCEDFEDIRVKNGIQNALYLRSSADSYVVSRLSRRSYWAMPLSEVPLRIAHPHPRRALDLMLTQFQVFNPIQYSTRFHVRMG